MNFTLISLKVKKQQHSTTHYEIENNINQP